MKSITTLLFSFMLLMSFVTFLQADGATTITQDDTVIAREALTPPVLDGKADDACWQDAAWQAIDQVWINWGEVMDQADFTGRYKVVWNSETDRLYFLVEITDDVLVDGYKFPMDGYYNWDVVEIFFDEDASGGDHTLNQNAFAYHITAGNDESEFEVMDLAANYAAMNYSDHFDGKIEFADGVYTWELGMLVYNENYDPQKTSNPTEQLAVGKISGLSIAYCDNDNPNENPKSRDNFIGSVAVPQANYNDHWMNADWFGTLKLDYALSVQEKSTVPAGFELLPNYPNPFNPNTTISFQLPAEAEVQLVVFNTLGQRINTLVNTTLTAGAHMAQWNGLDQKGRPVESGLYFCRLKAITANGIFQQTRKMILSR